MKKKLINIIIIILRKIVKKLWYELNWYWKSVEKEKNGRRKNYEKIYKILFKIKT